MKIDEGGNLDSGQGAGAGEPADCVPLQPATGVSAAWRGMARAKVVLITATVIADALAPIFQERATRKRGFEGSSMVLLETMSYFLGGLLLATGMGGLAGFWRCVRPARYLAFLPASAAFSTSNFLTYIAVRGLGASQFYLLAQLRVAVLAIFLRIWTGARQPPLAWLALVQLAAGMVVLVYFKATVASTSCTFSSTAGGIEEQLVGNSSALLARGGAAAAVATQASSSSLADLAGGLLALVGVVFSSAFAFIYMEWQLKSHAQDPLYVQLHQMNSFGAAVSLMIYLRNVGNRAATPSLVDHQRETAAALVASVTAAEGRRLDVLLPHNASSASLAALNVTGVAAQVFAAAAEEDTVSYSQILILISVVISRGVLSGSVLKQLDSIAKGLIDVTAIVVCTSIQYTMDVQSADGVVIGIQMLMLLSIMSYIMARSSAPAGAIVQQKPRVAPHESMEPTVAKAL